jgi:hypothetical protein
MLSRGDLKINCPNIRLRTQETPYRAIPLANKSSIIREGGWCCQELANGRYIGHQKIVHSESYPTGRTSG